MQLTQPFVLPSYFSPHPAPSSSHVFTWKGFAHPRGNTLKWGSPLGAGCVRDTIKENYSLSDSGLRQDVHAARVFVLIKP
ncbi:hypothetical protein Y1Q_0024655 [Alligator mississippiensis]|uniref:Uncharacterized protein n=1 Tax=Alligator mississippiensis TaxID=8496 RepID=A0A151NB66_ALLMI|nr:hypothetical protein Y1Q_0024655 [Alligator mississippiensis]